ncbi:MAG: alpha/beta fold hydrolase [Acutalibacteraceae bacterium]
MLYFDAYSDREKSTILMLHGAGALDTFCQQYYLSDKYHLVVPHLPGSGKAAGEVYQPQKTKEELFELIESLNKKKIALIGHSLGAQIAVSLISERPELFNCAVFLSAWVNPTAKTVRKYCGLSGICAKMLHIKPLVRFQGKYWNYTDRQADYMAEYSKNITAEVYRSFFEQTLDLKKLPSYQTVPVPMLAVCGSNEVKDMKTSLDLLSKNPNCKTEILKNAGHDFPMRNAEKLNRILDNFFSRHI